MVRAYTGGLMERELFGEFEPKQEKPPKYLDFNNAITIVIDNQPGDPTDPQADFARDLHYAMVQKLDPIEEDCSNLRFYTAVGSQLDWHHGVDGFFIYTDKNTGFQYLITIDLTMDPSKSLPGKKAEYLLYVNEDQLDVKFNKKEYDHLMQLQSSELVRLIKKKIANREVYP